VFSSRNLHFIVLGVIIGAAVAYVFAFYQAESSFPPQAAAQPSGLPPNHPDLGSNNEQMLELLKKAIEEKPDQPEMIARYANILFNMGRFDEALGWFTKVLELQPDNLDARSLRGAIYWRLNRIDDAAGDLQGVLKRDPNHIPSLYGMVLLSLHHKDLPKAAEYFKKIETIDPGYEGLADLRRRLEEERNKAGK
jgi:tetratricopeptide (TPR) repeat protein